MRNLLVLALVSVCSVVNVAAQTVTVTSSASSYSPTGGTITFTVNLSYSGTLSALGVSIGTFPTGLDFWHGCRSKRSPGG